MLGLVFWLPYFYPLSHTLKFFWVFFYGRRLQTEGYIAFSQRLSLCVKVLLLNPEWKKIVIVLGWCVCLLAFGESSSLSPSGHLWPSQLISGPGHPAPPFAAPVLRCLAAGIPGDRALLLILRLHHALAVGSPHGFCLLSLLSEGRQREAVGEKANLFPAEK